MLTLFWQVESEGSKRGKDDEAGKEGKKKEKLTWHITELVPHNEPFGHMRNLWRGVRPSPGTPWNSPLEVVVWKVEKKEEFTG